MLATWQRGNAQDKCCAAIHLSGLLLHELLHLAGYNTISDTPGFHWLSGNGCYGTYVISNSYLWAMAHRYRNTSNYCSGLYNDCLFGYNAPWPVPGMMSGSARTPSVADTWGDIWDQFVDWLNYVAAVARGVGRAIAELFDSDTSPSGCDSRVCGYCPDLCEAGCVRTEPAISRSEWMECVRNSAAQMFEDSLPTTSRAGSLDADSDGGADPVL